MKPTTVIAISLALLLGFATSCTTTDIKSAPTINVPRGLDLQTVKLAIVSAVYPEKAPREWTPMEKMTDNALSALFGFYYQKVDRGTWFVEEIRPNSVLVGFDNGKHYFRVEYVIQGDFVAQRIDGSRNLRQSKDEIHKAVFEWLGIMESKIRQSLGMYAAMQNAGRQ